MSLSQSALNEGHILHGISGALCFVFVTQRVEAGEWAALLFFFLSLSFFFVLRRRGNNKSLA